MVKMWLIALLLCVPILAVAEPDSEADDKDGIRGWEASVPEDPNEPPEDWMDSSHGYATEQAQALTEWMDSFFGEPNYEIEQPESLLRLDLTSDWDQDDGTNNNIRLRGKIQLPKLSKRLNLVFSDESGDELDPLNEERKLDDSVGLLYEVSESKRSRFDLTMGISWNHLRPGVRYRFQDQLGELSSYRLTQRLQYENGEGAYATSQAELNRVLGKNQVLRWNNRAVYGEETDGTEWVTRLSLFQRQKTVKRRRELGISYFGAINGVTDPESYVKNYRLGVLFRRQVYRKYLFLELEPAYNYRQRQPDEKRQFAWSVALRLQIALERDLARKKNNNRNKQNTGVNSGNAAPAEPLLAPEETGSHHQPAADSLPADYSSYPADDL